MSSVVYAWSSRSSFSSIHDFHRAIFAIVPAKFSQTQQVQLAPVRPPARMSSKTLRSQFETISPSKTIISS